MRILKLRLLAFGPFSDVEIDFAPRGVQIVYGRNEAGKSTTLRAIAGLLYGIPKSTSDAHLHKMPDLRIGGSLADENGHVLEIVRRKGRDNTLLDPDGLPVDEASLRRMLGGVGEEQFATMFGLDHVSLREGGEALLLGEGNVGESLFGAAMAGGELHQVLRSLRAEAEALFTPKAHTRPLNDAIRAWSEAHKRARVESMSPDSVIDQMRGLEELRRERADCEAERHRLQTERAKLERAARALPILSKRNVIAGQREAMGHVIVLSPDAAGTRIEQQRIAIEAAREAARLEEQTRELSERIARLAIPESLVRLPGLPFDITNRLGSQRKASADLPRIQVEIEDFETQAREILRKIGRDVPLSEAQSWRIDAASHAAIKQLAVDLTALAKARQKTRHDRAEKAARHAALVKRLASLPPAADVGALKKALQRAEREGPLDDRLATLTSRMAHAEHEASLQLSSLGLAAESAGAAAALRVPSSETVDKFARRFGQLDRDTEQLAEQRSLVEQRLADLARDIEAIGLAGKIPTEGDLSTARQRRDESWKLIRDAFHKEGSRRSKRDELLDRHEVEAEEADRVADRLRVEADRVSRLAVFVADRATKIREQEGLRRKATDLESRRTTLSKEWDDAWRGVGIEAQPPGEMKEWLVRHAQIVRAAGALREAEGEVAALRESLAFHRRSLHAQLAAHGSPPPTDITLTDLLDRAAELAASADAAAGERARTERDIHDLESDIAALIAADREEESHEALLVSAWRAAVAPLGLPETVSPTEVTVTIEHLAEAFHKIDQANVARRRAASIERDARAFASDVQTLAREHAPDLTAAPPETAASDIIERFQQGKRALAERREMERQLDETTRLLAVQRERRASAESTLDELFAKASVRTTQALEEAERRSEEASRLDQELARLDAQLLDLGGDASSLKSEFEEWNADDATARLTELEAELDALHERSAVVAVRIQSVEAGLKKLDAPEDTAAQAALEAEGALARVRELAERYLTVRLASVVLGREIERYRQENQGPILARASELFRRLTLGSFSALKVDFDDRDNPVLVGARSDGRELGASAMSDGTRDQLFLALRIATLERYAENNDPLPLVVDDILVHFDDERAMAALEVLADLSGRAQVLLFTHHARLVELAERAIDPALLRVRELGEPAGQPPAASMAKPVASAIVAPKMEPR